MAEIISQRVASLLIPFPPLSPYGHFVTGVIDTSQYSCLTSLMILCSPSLLYGLI